MGFFQTSRSIDEIEIIDLLFSRYGSASKQVLEYEFEMGVEIINKAYAMKDEEKIYSRWLMGYEKEMSFGDFKKKLLYNTANKATVSNKTEKEILLDVKRILEMR